MAARYNNLVQTGKIKAFDFQFQQCADNTWHCETSEPEAFFGTASRKRDAKEAVARQICDWYDWTQATDDADIPDPGFTVWVLVDADSLSNTLRNLARYEDVGWLVVQGFANEVTVLEGVPWHVYRSQGSLREAADHLLTWHTAQLVQTLGMPNCFIVVSRDAALQNTVQLIREAGHKAVYCPRDLGTIREVLQCVAQ